ncbi:MAG: VWA domain-containing protein [Vicinamibacterales bacterium]
MKWGFHVARQSARLCCAAALCVLASAHAVPAGQAQDNAATPAFRSGVDLVALNVTLTDGQHEFVGDLTEHDFAVFEDGVKQDLSFFAFGRVPLDLAILLDTSSSMIDTLQTAQEAAIGFVETVQPGDRITTIQINDRADILHPLTGDAAAAIEAIRRTKARGATALYNGLYMAMTGMVESRRSTTEVRRQALVVLSDGQDTSSLLALDEVMALAKESGIAVYTIALLSPLEIRRLANPKYKYFAQSQFVMKSLADVTGARAFVARNAGELDGIYRTIADELAHQYTLGYVSKSKRRDDGFRRVIVQVVDRPDVQTRTRTGYQTPRPRPAPVLP